MALTVGRGGHHMTSARISRVWGAILLIITIFSLRLPAHAQTSRYIFLPDQSTLVQTGGIAGVQWTYAVEGQLLLTVDSEAGTASFTQVDANAVDNSPLQRTLDPNEVFAMTSLLGTVQSDNTLEFTGQSADGSDIHITAILQEDVVHLVAETVPPPNSADFFLYKMDALAQRKYSGGTGEPNDPYQIATAADLIALGETPEDYDRHFILTADIDLDPNLPGRKVFDKAIIASDPAMPFTGVFDGGGHTISNFTLTSDGGSPIGLFGTVGYADRRGDPRIRDLGLVEPYIDAKTGSGVGALVGHLAYGAITDCYVELGSVAGGGSSVGGLLGGFMWGTLRNCSSAANVTGDDSVGGLVGGNHGGTLVNCCATGNATGDWRVGGLVGQNGIFAEIIYCYATGDLVGNQGVGGLVGWNRIRQWSAGRILHCYSVGRVFGTTNVGGLVGLNWGIVESSFWDIETSGINEPGYGEGRTTAQMQDPDTFRAAGWDFAGSLDGCLDIWAEPLGGGYPILWWQVSPLPELPFSGGTGQPDDPYLISIPDELNSLSHNPRLMTAHFRLLNDIDLRGVDFLLIGSELFPFAGVFNGNANCISNFSHIASASHNVGLFAYVDNSDAEIKDLGLIAPAVTAIEAWNIGALVGFMRRGTIRDCYVKGGSISGQDDVGGLVGQTWGTVTGSHSSCAVSGDKWVGGLLGSNRGNGQVSSCCSTGPVHGNQAVGGLVGMNLYGRVTDCYSSSPVAGEQSIGGLVGENRDEVSECYSTGMINGEGQTGGLVGINQSGNVSNSFWDMETSSQAKSAGGTGKTTAEMQTAKTFLDAGWDFVDETANGTEDIWWIDEGKDYPRLWWELIPGN